MSTESRALDDLTEQYPHRTAESIRTDADAEEILDGYMEQQGVEIYSTIDSDFPYQALMGRVTDAEADVTLKSRYTFPDDQSYSKGFIDATVSVHSIEDTLEDNVIPEDRNILDVAGVTVDEDKEMSTPSDNTLRVHSVHCIVFYEEPVVSTTPDTSLGSSIERINAREATSEPSLATALIHSGKKPSGDNFAEARIDYWTKTFDGIDDGLDYTGIDWENPGH